jgi:hypothetical protein
LLSQAKLWIKATGSTHFFYSFILLTYIFGYLRQLSFDGVTKKLVSKQDQRRGHTVAAMVGRGSHQQKVRWRQSMRCETFRTRTVRNLNNKTSKADSSTDWVLCVILYEFVPAWRGFHLDSYWRVKKSLDTELFDLTSIQTSEARSVFTPK